VPADTSRNGKLTDQVADRLRELILLSGDWEDRHIMPSEAEMAKEHGVSKTTMRRAIDVLVGEGLIEKGQGKHSRVRLRPPAYRLVINQTQAGRPTDWVAEPPLSIRRPETGSEKRKWTESTVAVPRGYAASLGLEPHAKMVQRVMKLTIDGEPILTSTSYLPVDLAEHGTEDGTGWRDAEIGQLALNGYVVTSEFMEDQNRMPAPTERAALGMPKNVLIRIISHQCQVLMADQTILAGVIVLARSDRVCLRWYRPKPAGWPSE